MSARRRMFGTAIPGALLAATALAPAHGGSSAAAQEALVIRGGTVHTMAGEPFQGTVVVVDGVIREVGPSASAPAGAKVIDATGLHVYPGMFDAVSQLGLTEIGAVDVTNDARELGTFNPHLQASTAVHPPSEHIPVARANGITHTIATPQGAPGGIPGWGSLVNLDGWTVEEMEMVGRAALVLVWPSMGGGFGGFGGGGFGGGSPPSFREREERYREAVQRLGEWLDAARHYDQAVTAGRPVARDLKLEGLVPVVSGERPVLVQARDERQIRDAVAFGGEQRLRIVIAGGEEAHKVASLLAEKDVPVILGPTQDMPPSGPDASYAEAYARPGILHAAGVRIAFATFGASDSRTLPYEAAMGIPFGLPREAALRGVTTSGAEMLGLGDLVGTLEAGKVGNLIVTDGDPLEITTTVRHLVIDGREADMMNRHLELYERYRSRPGPSGSRPAPAR